MENEERIYVKQLGNEERIMLAELALSEAGFGLEEEDIIDLITYLLHLAYRDGYDTESILRMAEINFEGEK